MTNRETLSAMDNKEGYQMSKYFEICPTSKTTVVDLELLNKFINAKFCIDSETSSINMLQDAEFEGISYTSCVHDDYLINICGLLYLGILQKCREMEGELSHD